MKILLIEPKRTNDKETTLETHYTYPHLGLLSLASNLESEGYSVEYFSTNNYNDPLLKLESILQNQYDYIGISTITATISFSLIMAKKIKEKSPKTKIIFGGTHAWLYPEEVLTKSAVDFVIRGLGELPFIDLIKNKPFSEILGLCYRDEKKIIIKKPYFPTNKDLQKIKSMLHYSGYEKTYQKANSFRNTRHLVTSFGCPFDCNFCSVPKLYGKCMIFREIGTVIKDVIELSKKTNRIMFVDPDLNINKDHFMNLFNAILQEKKSGNIHSKIKFIIQARLDCFDKEILELSKKVGIIALIGIESLSQRVRDLDLNKGGKIAKMDSNEVKMNLDQIKEYVWPYLYFILATPETKLKDLIENLEYIKGLKKGGYEINIHITPFPETNYYSKYKDSELMLWEEIEGDSNIKKIPTGLKCKDSLVENYIDLAFIKSQEIISKNKRLNFSNTFLKELMKELNI